jgi:hypothetical protein
MRNRAKLSVCPLHSLVGMSDPGADADRVRAVMRAARTGEERPLKTTLWERTECRMPGCRRPVRVKKHGLCTPHYKRYQRLGDPGGKIKEYQKLKPYQPKVA